MVGSRYGTDAMKMNIVRILSETVYESGDVNIDFECRQEGHEKIKTGSILSDREYIEEVKEKGYFIYDGLWW